MTCYKQKTWHRLCFLLLGHLPLQVFFLLLFLKTDVSAVADVLGAVDEIMSSLQSLRIRVSELMLLLLSDPRKGLSELWIDALNTNSILRF